MNQPLNSNVSSEEELLILVNAQDESTGFLSKAECHDGAGVLHRAFSLFLFNKNGELLLQQRSAEKRLWPLFWSNSCCSHPRKGESLELAAQRRLSEELNAAAELEFVYKFSYQAEFGSVGSENEMCSVFFGRLDSNVIANDSEIAATRFISAQDLSAELAKNPQSFTPWLRMEWQHLNEVFADSIARFTARD